MLLWDIHVISHLSDVLPVPKSVRTDLFLSLYLSVSPV